MSAFAATSSCTFVSRPSFAVTLSHRPLHRYASRSTRTYAAPLPTAVITSASASTSIDPDALGHKWEDGQLTPTEMIEHALLAFGSDVAIAFSGAEDVLLIEYASQTKLPFRVFALDTGRLHPQTLRFYNAVELHYGIRIEYTFPDAADVTKLVNEKGLFSFYQDGHRECCGIRKVKPLREKLSTLRAWITGQRKDQSPSTRTHVPFLQLDPSFKGVDGTGLAKYNPLARTTGEEVWTAIRVLEVPYNALHEQGFVSIGCEPCTKPVLPNQHEREGRWWWESDGLKECGLHKGNIRSNDAAQIKAAEDFVLHAVQDHPVTVFTKKDCEYSLSLLQFLDNLRVPYNNTDISELNNFKYVVNALETKYGTSNTPYLFVNQGHVGGIEEARRLHSDGAFVPMLENAGIDTNATA